MFEKHRQDVVEGLVTDGGVELLEGFGSRFTNLLQRITQGLTHGGNQRLGEHQNLTQKHSFTMMT